MKKYFCLVGLLSIFYLQLQAQDIPLVQLSDLNGKTFESSKFNAITNKPIVLSFWATWCIPCLNELTAVNDNIEAWRDKNQFSFFAIAEDDSRTIKKVAPLAKGKGWDFTVLLDKNQDLKRALNFANIPYTIILKNGVIIYRRIGYVAGNENELLAIIKANQ